MSSSAPLKCYHLSHRGRGENVHRAPGPQQGLANQWQLLLTVMLIVADPQGKMEPQPPKWACLSRTSILPGILRPGGSRQHPLLTCA